MTIPFEEATSIGRPFIDLGEEVATALLLTIEGGWSIARRQSQVTPDATEVAITECLREGMREALNTSDLPWGRGMIIAPGSESKSRLGLLRPDGLTDIPVYVISVFLSSGSHDPHAIIECKRIAESSADLVREYVVEGIDRFRTAKYAADHRIGFMVGYVIAGSANGAVARVNGYLEKNKRSSEQLSTAGLLASNGVWFSRHPRPDTRSPVEIHHTMATVAENPVAASTTSAKNGRAQRGQVTGPSDAAGA